MNSHLPSNKAVQTIKDVSFIKYRLRGGLHHKALHLNLRENAGEGLLSSSPFLHVLPPHSLRTKPDPNPSRAQLSPSCLAHRHPQRTPIPNSQWYPSSIWVHRGPGTIASVLDSAVLHPGKHGLRALLQTVRFLL